MADIEIGYKGSTITSINSGGVTTLNTIGTFCEDNITVTFNKTQGEAFTPATTITTNPSITLSATTGTITAFYSGASNITPTVTPGYVSAGTAGIVRTSGTSIYQLSTVASQTITPTTASQLAVASGRFTTGSVYVGAIPSTYVQPAGTLTISANGTYDVTEYASVSTNISEGERFAPIYKNLAYRNTLYASGSSRATYGGYTASDITDWCDSLSSIRSQQFMGQYLSGNFVFNNVTFVDQYAFAFLYLTGFGGTMPTYTVTLPKVSSMGYSPFAYNSGLTSIYCPSITSIREEGFYSCGRLASVSFPNCTYIGRSAFYNCGALTSVSFSSCSYIGGGAFQTCTALTSISFPNCTSIGNNAFYNCTALTSISFPNCTYIGNNTFNNCTALTSISFPNCTYIGNNTFNNCTALTSISFPNCTSIGTYAFQTCTALTSVNFPNCTSINAYAFQYCSALTSVNFPNCTLISAYAFRTCIALTLVNLPACTFIEGNVFSSCFHLLSLYLLGSSLCGLSAANAFYSTPISNYTTSTGGVHGSIFVRASLYDSYLTAKNWSWFSSRFVSLTDAEIEALGF